MSSTGVPRVPAGTQLSPAPRRLVIALLLWVLLALALAANQAAAALETPLVEAPTELKATTALLHGVLDPASTGEPGSTYQFIYRASKTACKGAGEHKSTEGLSLAEEHEAVSQAIEGLTANTQYTVCLAITNSTKTETLVSSPLTFKTALPPEAPQALKAEPITTSTAKLHGILDPKKTGNPGSFEFLYRESSSGCQGEGEKVTGSQPATGAKAQIVEAEASPLLPNATYAFCLLARNEAGETALSPALTFTTLPVKPTVEAEATSSITEASAALTAQINPNGAETTYQMQYGTTTGYGSSTPLTPIGSGRGPALASQTISGLTANTTYHWRLQVTNAAGSVTGPDRTFVDDTAGATLPDHRAYELVTPAQKNEALFGELLFGEGGLSPEVAADGQRVIAMSIQCFANSESCKALRQSEGQPFAFERTAAGWVTHPLSPPNESFATDSLWSFNAESANTVFSAPHFEGTIQEDFYGREGQGAIVNVGPFGEHATFTHIENFNSTDDLSHILYQTKAVGGGSGSVWSFDPTLNKAAYEYTMATGDAAPLMVGVSGGYEEGHDHKLISTCGTFLGGNSLMSRDNGPLSEDGRTVYFTAEGHTSSNCPSEVHAPAANELYARVDGERGPPEDAHSVLVSGPTPTACTSEECHKSTTEEANARNANFEAASADGSRALFTDTQQLSDNASEDPNPESKASAGCTAARNNTPGTGGCNLYESVCAQSCGTPGEEPQAAGRELIDVSETSGHAKVAGGPRVQGLVASSADGSHVYFIAKGVLTGGEQNQSHEAAEEEKENLYVYAESHVAFVARLAPSDTREWHEGGSANVTPSGRFLVLSSHRSLMADASCVEGEAEEAPVCPAQIYEYDAQTRDLVRISVGERGFNDNGNDGLLGSASARGGNGGDARIVERVHEGGSVPRRLDPTMSDDGAFVFFQSPVALTPGALNDAPVGEAQFAENVYEYHEGHVSLISDGKDTTPESRITVSPVELLGSDASGANVFFTTFDQLVGEDSDTQRDIYDAHICSTSEPCPPPKSTPVPCEGEACYSQVSSPPVGQGPSGSHSFTGPGNLTPPPPPKAKTAAQIRAEKLAKALKACHKVRSKAKRLKCERQARKQFGPVKKASRARRAKRAAHHRGGRS